MTSSLTTTIGWNKYFMRIANEVSSRATCDRKHVGCVIVRARNILATGYNGSISGQPHCDEAGHMMVENNCVRTIHAEINAIASSAKNGVSLAGSSAYITAFPCWNCFKVLANVGITHIYYCENYKIDENILEIAKSIPIKIKQISLEEGCEEDAAL